MSRNLQNLNFDNLKIWQYLGREENGRWSSLQISIITKHNLKISYFLTVWDIDKWEIILTVQFIQ